MVSFFAYVHSVGTEMSLLLLLLLPLFANGAGVASFNYFCLNQTSNVITFIADVTSLYNTSNPTTQWASIGLDTYPTLANQLPFTSLPAIQSSLPSTLPVPMQVFLDDINSNNNFVFAGQTQDTYQLLNTRGPVVAVQMINDSTTGHQLKMRFFFNLDVNKLAQNCTFLGCTFQGSTNGSNNATIFRSTIPIYMMYRDSHGNVGPSSGGVILTATRELAGADITVTVSQGQPKYNVDTFIEASKIETTGCSGGQVRALLTVGMAYSTLPADNLNLVQGPLSASDIAVSSQGCYNFSVSKFQRPFCSTNSSCLGQIQLQTQCRSPTRSFLLCDNGSPGVPATWLDFTMQARQCTGTRTRPRNCTSGISATSTADAVWSSVNFNAALVQPVLGLSTYLAPTQFLSDPTTSVFQAAPVVALMAQGPDIAEYIPLAINTTSLSFDVSGTILSYPQMVTAHFITFGVKASGASQFLEGCDQLQGCDSFVLNQTMISKVYPTAMSAIVAGIQPSGATTYAPLQVTVQLVSSSPVPDIHTHNMFVIRNSYIVFGVFAAAAIIVSILVICLV